MRDTFDMDLLIQRIVKENRAELEKIEKRKLAAQALGKTIAQALQAADPEIKAVWGFGSTYEAGRPYRLDSDIDLAIEGGDILMAWQLADRLAKVAGGSGSAQPERPPFLVDVIALSEDPFSRMVRERGLRLA